MITGYHRPESLEETLILLQKPGFRPLGGGTVLNRRSEEKYEVVDLQELKLDKIHKSGERLEIGATTTLQALLECSHINDVIRITIQRETPINLRNMGTVAGTLVTSDGRSPLCAILLALDARLTLRQLPQQAQDNPVSSEVINIGEFLARRNEILPGRLITGVEIALDPTINYQYISRTPADKPLINVATAVWNSGRTRIIVGGWGKMPVLAMDGNDSHGAESAARNAAHDATDEWATAEYRREMAALLTQRCLGL